MDGGIIIGVTAIVKGVKRGEKRMVEVEASNEAVDSEGDVILQKALLDSADTFIKSGHFDIDHLSEIGARIGIPNPTSFIVGRPSEVVDLGKGRTGVVGEIMRASDGKVDVKKNRYDEFWESLQSEPPVIWQASIYGFPKAGQIDDCRETSCDSDAARFLVKGIDWRSLAFTRNPINTSLKGHAKVVTAKAMAASMLKDYSGGMAPLAMGPASMPTMPDWPRNLDDLWGQYERHIKRECQFCQGEDGVANSVAFFREHFIWCCMMPSGMADIAAHALMMLVINERKRAAGTP